MTNTIHKLSRLPISSDFVWPIADSSAQITSFYGCREQANRVDSRCPSGSRMHNGLDIIAIDRRSPIRAVYGGIVTHATPVDPANPSASYTPGFSNYGRVVAIKHFPGLYTLSAHLNDVLVRPGDVVERGQVIGHMGQTRGSDTAPSDTFHDSGAHLHFEMMRVPYPVRSSVDRVDPLDGFREGARFFTLAVL